MKIFNIQVFGFEAAIRGMRNPRDSQDKSDSTFKAHLFGAGAAPDAGYLGEAEALENPRIGPSDMKLMQTLIKRGGSHRKFLRMIQVWCDLELPRYVWVDLDTYKIGTVKNCQSSTYVLGNCELSRDNFEGGEISGCQLSRLHELQAHYRKNKSAETMLRLKRNLPESFLQTATYGFNYEVALAIYRDRKNHLLPEFSGPGGLCEMIERLPYMWQFLSAAKAGGDV